jgi:hypothetical protein
LQLFGGLSLLSNKEKIRRNMEEIIKTLGKVILAVLIVVIPALAGASLYEDWNPVVKILLRVAYMLETTQIYHLLKEN